MSDVRRHLPDVRDEDNPIIWCDRCQRHHKKYTFTRHDYDRVIRERARRMADCIDAGIAERIYGR